MFNMGILDGFRRARNAAKSAKDIGALAVQAQKMHTESVALSREMERTGMVDPAAVMKVARRWGDLVGIQIGSPPSNFVKRTSCSACGAPKELPSTHSYLYCDFCAHLVDFDLRRAMEQPVALHADPDYVRIAQTNGARAEVAVQEGDRDLYRQLQTELLRAQILNHPISQPPRAWNDLTYRDRYVEFTVDIQVLTAFDPEAQRNDENVRRAAAAIKWHGMSGKAVPETIWPMVDAFLAQHEHTQSLIANSGLLAKDPDQRSSATLDRMTRSTLAQGWLPTVDDEHGRRLIELLGIRHEYHEARKLETLPRHCGGCGSDLETLPGARTVVCPACGRRVSVDGVEITCLGCNGQISMEDGRSRANCPYCKAEVRRPGLPGS